MENITLPQELASFIEPETKDFVVKAGRLKPLSISFYLIFFGIFLIGITIIFVFSILVPLFSGEEIHFETNGVSTVAGPDNLSPIIRPTIFIGFFMLVGILVFFLGIYTLFKKGSYFVGTPTRLVYYQNKKIKAINWEKFAEEIKVSGNNQKGNIVFQKKIETIINKEKRPDRSIPNVLYISEIPNVFEIEKICRRRIRENDPIIMVKN